MDWTPFAHDTDEPETLTLVPGRYCFVHLVKHPPGLEGKSLEAFAEYALEGLSPFPLEQLAWGYLEEIDTSELLLHAAYKPRLSAEGLAPFPESTHILPVFMAVFPLRMEARTCFFLLYKDELSLIIADADRTLPTRVESRFLPEDPEDNREALFAAREQLLAEITPREDTYIDPGIVELNTAEVRQDGSLSFHFSRLRGPEAEPEPMPSNHIAAVPQLWHADMRDRAFIDGEVRRRSLGERLWKSLRWGGIAASVLLGLMLLQWALETRLNGRENRIAAQDTAVLTVEGRQEMLLTLKSFSAGALQPFAILETLNRYRPAEIYFQSVTGSEGNVMQVKGIAPNQTKLNHYAEILEKSRLFDYVRVPDRTTTGGQVRFTLEIKYAPLPAGTTPTQTLVFQPIPQP